MAVQMDADWQSKVFGLTDAMFQDRLGPEIKTDAQQLCPVFGEENSTATAFSIELAKRLGRDEPGGLRDSIEDHLNGHTLIVAATGGGGRAYAYWVETGHYVKFFGHWTGNYKGPQPFLRPALYQVRSSGLGDL
jgi:hypothetical protein